MSDNDKKTPDGRSKGSSGKKPAGPTKARAPAPRADDEPEFNTVVEKDSRKKQTKTPISKTAKPGISRSSALMMSVLAALAGGAIGWGGPTLFGGQSAKNEAVQAALEQTRSDLAAAQAEQKKLADSLAAIQGSSRTQATSNQSITSSLATLEDEVSKLRETQSESTNEAIAALEDRISSLGALTLPAGEGEESSSVDLSKLIDRIDTLESGGSDEIASRLDKLETQLTELGTRRVTFPEPDTTPIELPPVEAEESAEETLQILIDTFPRATMLESVAAQEALAAEKPSWLQRTLSRHVKTHDDDVVDPVDTINAAETALKRGEVTKALDLISELNPPVRAVAAEWIGAAKSAAKRIEKDL